MVDRRAPGAVGDGLVDRFDGGGCPVEDALDAAGGDGHAEHGGNEVPDRLAISA